ncbi:MAG: DUF4197 domain-containing protein [Bacteroidales bacterium]|nr:DUF4197 domain-containing protein [Bacteroidales bacterium]MCF8328327.1 DUF4197 domain-containing protein [Bacteroidales bacterium]
MRNYQKLIMIGVTILFFSSCEILKDFEPPVSPEPDPLSEAEVADGLKQALQVGTKNAVEQLEKKNALYKNSQLRIPFPEEAKIVENKLRQVGLGDQVDKFVKKMNHGAEAAMAKAQPVFVDAIKEMTIKDAWNILKGPDSAATKYFYEKTHDELYQLFKPEIKETLNEMQVTKLWSDVMTAYNKLPIQQEEVNTDLPDYVTQKAMDRLFDQIAAEELKIRENPVARVTDLLKKVFSRQ